MYTVTDTLAAAGMKSDASVGALCDTDRNTHPRKRGETGGWGVSGSSCQSVDTALETHLGDLR